MAREIKAEPFTGGAEGNAPGWHVRQAWHRWTLWGPRPESILGTFADGRPIVQKARTGWQLAYDNEAAQDGHDDAVWKRDTLDEVLALCPPAVARAFEVVAR